MISEALSSLYEGSSNYVIKVRNHKDTFEPTRIQNMVLQNPLYIVKPTVYGKTQD